MQFSDRFKRSFIGFLGILADCERVMSFSVDLMDIDEHFLFFFQIIINKSQFYGEISDEQIKKGIKLELE